MALPKHKTTLSKLRTILGQGPGNAARFAKKIHKSKSWLTKVSCGQMPLTREAALSIEYETGVSHYWLLAGDVDKPPYDKNLQPYNLETYAKNRDLDKSPNFEDRTISEQEFTTAIWELLEAFYAAVKKNRGGLLALELSQVADQARKRFGVGDIIQNRRAASIALDILNGILRLKETTPEKLVNLLGAIDEKPEDRYLSGKVPVKEPPEDFVCEAAKKTPARRKPQPSLRKPRS